MPYTKRNKLMPFYSLGCIEELIKKPLNAFVVRECSEGGKQILELAYYFKVECDEGVNIIANELMALTIGFLCAEGMPVKPDLDNSGFLDDKQFEEIRHWATGIAGDWKSNDNSPETREFNERTIKASREIRKELEDKKLVKKYFAVSKVKEDEVI